MKWLNMHALKYENRDIFPKSTMYLMSGASGAGKTTFAKQILKVRPDIRYLCIDDFYAMYGGSETSHAHEFEVWQAFYQAIHLAMEDDVSVLIDTNAPTRVMRSQFIDWFGKFDEYVLIFINSSLDDCIKRNGARTRQIPLKTLQSIYEQVEHPYLLEDTRWDSIDCYRCTYVDPEDASTSETKAYEEYSTPVAGPGCIAVRTEMTRTMDKYLSQEDENDPNPPYMFIVIPARRCEIHDKEATVTLTIAKPVEGIVGEMQVVPYTGIISNINIFYAIYETEYDKEADRVLDGFVGTQVEPEVLRLIRSVMFGESFNAASV